MNKLDKLDKQKIAIIKEYIGKSTKINGMKLKKWLDQHDQIRDYLNNILLKYPNLTKISNICGILVNDIDIELLRCKVCNKFLNIKNWLLIDKVKYCSKKCAMNDKQLLNKRSETISKDKDFYKRRTEKTVETNLKRYGTKTPAESEEIKQKMKSTFAKDLEIWDKRNAKNVQTCLKKYGVDNVLKCDIIKEKIKKTCLEKYGVQNPNQLNEIKEKIKQTNLEKYGVDNQFKRPEVIAKNIEKSWNQILKWKDFVLPLFTFEEYSGYNKNQIYKWKCVKCKHEFEQPLYHTKISDISTRIPRCLHCYPKENKSFKEIELQNFCEQYFSIIKNDRQLIKPLQLDIVIPEKKLAFEFNGIYWHSDTMKNNSNYHVDKTVECEKLDYRLIHIWEYDWVNPIKQNILKEKIKAILGIEQTKIYARNCLIKEISVKQKNQFLNTHHIQGADKSKIKLGLFYENELIAIMTFGKPRFNKNYEYELIRYATKSSYHVLGGAGKLLKYFERKFNPKSIITYADRSYSQGNMYKQLGFNLLKINDPSYNWVKGSIIFSRYQCAKNKLKLILGESFNQNLSETENMLLNGFSKVYDCGTYVFVKFFK